MIANIRDIVNDIFVVHYSMTCQKELSALKFNWLEVEFWLVIHT